MKKTIVVISIVLFVIASSIGSILYISKYYLPKIAAVKIAQAVTGMNVFVESANLDILNTQIYIQDLLVFNPKNFQDKIMIDVDQLFVNFDTKALTQKSIKLLELRLHINELVIIKGKDNTLNLEYLTIVKAQKQGKTPEEIAIRKAPEIAIETLNLKIDKVVYKDYTKGENVKPQIFSINVNETFQNVDDIYYLMNIIVVNAIQKASLGQIVSISIDALTKPIVATLGVILGTGKKKTDIVLSNPSPGSIEKELPIELEKNKKENVNEKT